MYLLSAIFATKLKMSRHYCVYTAVRTAYFLIEVCFKLVVFYGQGFAVPPFTAALFALRNHTLLGSTTNRSFVRYFTTICELSAENGKNFILFFSTRE